MASRSELRLAAAALAILLLADTDASLADESGAPAPGLFAAGSVDLSFSATGFSRYDHGYLLLGAGGGYYLLDGFELTVAAIYWLGGEPVVTSVSPRARYVFWQVPLEFKPYVGGGVSHWFVSDGLDDVVTVGARAGVTGEVSHHARMSFDAGLAAERVVSGCDDCWLAYPEFALSVTF